jgi:hypothetical protein
MNITIYTFENISQIKFDSIQQLRDAVYEYEKKSWFQYVLTSEIARMQAVESLSLASTADSHNL